VLTGRNPTFSETRLLVYKDIPQENSQMNIWPIGLKGITYMNVIQLIYSFSSNLDIHYQMGTIKTRDYPPMKLLDNS